MSCIIKLTDLHQAKKYDSTASTIKNYMCGYWWRLSVKI